MASIGYNNVQMEKDKKDGAAASGLEFALRTRQEGSQNIDSYSPEYVNGLFELLLEQDAEVSNLKAQLVNIKVELEKALENNFVDNLTGCLNMNFYEKIKKDNFNPEKDRNKIAIVFIDANGLKAINDTPIELGGGHDTGDQMIKDIANYLRENFREEDTVIRPYAGGDEFIVVCRNHDDDPNFEKNLNMRVENIRTSTEKESISFSFATGVAVFGTAHHNGKLDSDLDDTKKWAESRMYRCKNKMKNK